MFKSIGASLIAGVVLGPFLCAGLWLKGIPIDAYTGLAICSATSFATWLLLLRDHREEQNVSEGRMWTELQSSSADPLVAIVNAQQQHSFRQVFIPAASDVFEVNWILNATSFDYNRSVLSLRMTQAADEQTAKAEVNRIAIHCCGGWFLRTQTIGVVIWHTAPCFKAESLIAKTFGGRSGIAWAIVADESGRRVDASKTAFPLKTDAIYLNMIQWFSSRGFEVSAGELKTWLTEYKSPSNMIFTWLKGHLPDRKS